MEYRMDTCTFRKLKPIRSLSNAFQDLIGPIISLSKLRVSYQSSEKSGLMMRVQFHHDPVLDIKIDIPLFSISKLLHKGLCLQKILLDLSENDFPVS